MKTVETGKTSVISKRKVLKPLIIGIVILAIIGIVFVVYNSNFKPSAKATVAQQTVAVARGELNVTVTGSGPIASSTKSDITSNISGSVKKIYFKEGDKVKAGDLLIEVDDHDAAYQVQQIKNSIAQLQLTQNSILKDLNNLDTISPFQGNISDIQVKVGDTVSANSSILTITDESKLRLIVPFQDSHRKEIKKGQTVTVNAYDSTLDTGETVSGTVSYISTPSYTSQDGVEVYNVEILISNSGSLKADMVANAEINVRGKVLKSSKSGNLSYINSAVLKSKAGGTVKKINVKDGQTVNSGQILVELENEDLVISKETNTLKLQDLQSQLDSATTQLSYFKIYAPIGGIITSLPVEVTDNVQEGAVVCTVSDYESMEFLVDVDELDIAKIKVSQPVSITIDALPETDSTPLSGEVSEIAVEGTSADGVTTYPVTIKVNQVDKLKVGMNANAEILVSSNPDVLYVPIDAVQKRQGKSFVMVKADGSNAAPSNSTEKSENKRIAGTNSQRSGNPANIAMKQVETGVSNSDYIQIISGLKEGEEIIVPQASSTQTTQIGMPRMGMPGMGGPPAGDGQRQNGSIRINAK